MAPHRVASCQGSDLGSEEGKGRVPGPPTPRRTGSGSSVADDVRVMQGLIAVCRAWACRSPFLPCMGPLFTSVPGVGVSGGEEVGEDRGQGAAVGHQRRVGGSRGGVGRYRALPAPTPGPHARLFCTPTSEQRMTVCRSSSEGGCCAISSYSWLEQGSTLRCHPSDFSVLKLNSPVNACFILLWDAISQEQSQGQQFRPSMKELVTAIQ